MTKRKKAAFLQDLLIIGLSIGAAIALVKSELIAHLLTSTKELEFIGSFIAGIFFTSVFTTVPAIVALGEIAQNSSLLATAVLGGMGAVVGDLLIFRFVRDRFSQHLLEIVGIKGGARKMQGLFQRGPLRWVTFLLGGLIIASPLPDELGITLLGFSKMKLSWFIPLAFVFNSIGIFLIGLAARAVG